MLVALLSKEEIHEALVLKSLTEWIEIKGDDERQEDNLNRDNDNDSIDAKT